MKKNAIIILASTAAVSTICAVAAAELPRPQQGSVGISQSKPITTTHSTSSTQNGEVARAEQAIASSLADDRLVPASGEANPAEAQGLLAALKAGKYTVVAPIGSSPDNPLFPPFDNIHAHCPQLEPYITFINPRPDVSPEGIPIEATNNFSLYEIYRASRQTIYAYRAEDFKASTPGTEENPHDIRLSGHITIFSYPSCKEITSYPYNKGSGDRRWTQSIIKMTDENYFILDVSRINLTLKQIYAEMATTSAHLFVNK